MTDYCSFLICSPEERALVAAISTPKEWSIRLPADPSGRFWFRHGAVHSISHPAALGRTPGGFEQGLVVAISSASDEHAQNAVDLLQACCDVVDLNPNHVASGRSALPLGASDSIDLSVFRTHGFFERFVHFDHLWVAIQLTVNAWPDRDMIYAIHKLALSYDLDHVSWWSMHPSHAQKFQKASPSQRSHVSTAFAINAAFSVIEQLGLEVRSSQATPRWTKTGTPTWNPKVLASIESRLRDAGLDPSDHFDWIQRGVPSRAEGKLEPQFATMSPYGDQNTVRDLRLSLPEALHYCSYLRNFMTAHRFQEATQSLGPYEVFNVQSVARRLILGKGKCWRLQREDLTARRLSSAMATDSAPGESAI